jgi:hypothetical protein
VRAAKKKAQLVHNAEVQAVQTIEVSGNEMWSFVLKNRTVFCGEGRNPQRNLNSVAPKSLRSEIVG